MSKGDKPKHRRDFLKEPYYYKQKMAHAVEGQKAWCVLNGEKCFQEEHFDGTFLNKKKMGLPLDAFAA